MKRKAFLTSLSLFPLVKTFAKSDRSFFNAPCKTQADQEGPFYKKGAPARTVIEKNGIPLTITGTVLKASDCVTPVTNAIIDIWHCDSQGEYDNDGYKCRGVTQTDQAGKYSFTTIMPPPYGSRPGHIHIKVRAKGYEELTSQIYFKGDPKIKNDFARNAESGRVIEIKNNKENREGKFDIYI